MENGSSRRGGNDGEGSQGPIPISKPLFPASSTSGPSTSTESAATTRGPSLSGCCPTTTSGPSTASGSSTAGRSSATRTPSSASRLGDKQSSHAGQTGPANTVAPSSSSLSISSVPLSSTISMTSVRDCVAKIEASVTKKKISRSYTPMSSNPSRQSHRRLHPSLTLHRHSPVRVGCRPAR